MKITLKISIINIDYGVGIIGIYMSKLIKHLE